MRTAPVSIFLFLLSFAHWALAEEHGGGHGEHHGGIPRVVLYQAINVFLLFCILFWACRKTVPQFFATRYNEFMKQATEAARQKKELEDRKAELEARMAKLHRTADQSIAESKKDAELMYASELEKARAGAIKIDKDANNVLKIDEQKLSEKLRLETLAMSVTAAEEQLTKTDTTEKTRLNSQFNQRVEGATL